MSILEKLRRKYRKKGLIGVLAAGYRKIIGPAKRFYKKTRRRCIRFYLRKKYDYVIEKYKHYTPPENTPACSPEYDGVIWSMWWQGEDNCPDTVKICLESIRRHKGSHKFILITMYNYQEYINIPEYILSKVHAGYISFTHLSDIIRANLLAKYGGLWIDTTFLVTKDLPDEIFSAEYYTIRYFQHIKKNLLVHVYKRKWVIGFSAAHRNIRVFRFAAEMFAEYLKTHDKFPDYFFMDIILTIAFSIMPDFRSELGKIPDNNIGWFDLIYLCRDGKEWNPETYSELAASNTVLRLTFKYEYDTKTASGKETFYGHLLSEYGIV